MIYEAYIFFYLLGGFCFRLLSVSTPLVLISAYTYILHTYPHIRIYYIHIQNNIHMILGIFAPII